MNHSKFLQSFEEYKPVLNAAFAKARREHGYRGPVVGIFYVVDGWSEKREDQDFDLFHAGLGMTEGDDGFLVGTVAGDANVSVGTSKLGESLWRHNPTWQHALSNPPEGMFPVLLFHGGAGEVRYLPELTTEEEEALYRVALMPNEAIGDALPTPALALRSNGAGPGLGAHDQGEHMATTKPKAAKVRTERPRRVRGQPAPRGAPSKPQPRPSLLDIVGPLPPKQHGAGLASALLEAKAKAPPATLQELGWELGRLSDAAERIAEQTGDERAQHVATVLRSAWFAASAEREGRVSIRQERDARRRFASGALAYLEEGLLGAGRGTLPRNLQDELVSLVDTAGAAIAMSGERTHALGIVPEDSATLFAAGVVAIMGTAVTREAMGLRRVRGLLSKSGTKDPKARAFMVSARQKVEAVFLATPRASWSTRDHAKACCRAFLVAAGVTSAEAYDLIDRRRR